jgi:hypothetical protein
MSVQTLGTEELLDIALDPGAAPVDGSRALRILAVTAVFLGVTALAAATFVLSYSAIRTVVLQAGITPRLARGYPLLLDAMLVIVLAAILALRGAGLPSRLLAWVTLLLVMTVAAGADALHTAGRSMPHQAAAITAAVLPFVLVLVAFVLLLVMLRYARLRRSDGAAVARGAVHQFDGDDRAAQRAPAVAGFEHRLGAPTPNLAEPANDAVSEPATGATPYPADALASGWSDDDTDPGQSYTGLTLAEEALEVAASPDGEPDDDDGPVFHRLFSAPTPLDVELTEVQAAEAQAAEAETTEAAATDLEASETHATEAAADATDVEAAVSETETTGT